MNSHREATIENINIQDFYEYYFRIVKIKSNKIVQQKILYVNNLDKIKN